jgi:4'-phosphopantetheinyl transferase
MMKAGTAIVHIVSAVSEGSSSDHLLLSEEERQRAASFRFEKDAIRWSGFRAELRRILASVIHVAPQDVPIVLTPLGKPVLGAPFDGLHFSLSHCDDLALISLCTDGVIGVDVEPAMRAVDLSGCELTFCHPAEITELPAESRCQRLMEIWTAKESLLKAMGTGLTHPPETVCMHFQDAWILAESDLPLPGIESTRTLRLHHPALGAHIAALSMPASITRIDIVSNCRQDPPVSIETPWLR